MNFIRSRILNKCVWICISIFTFALTANAAMESSFWAMSAGNIDFSVASKTGVFRYYRVDRKAPLIEYLSINEGSVSQVEYKNTKWSYNWKNGNIDIQKGIVHIADVNGKEIAPGNRQILPQNSLEPENDIMEFNLTGKLISNWKENFKFSQQKENSHSLEISCSRDSAETEASFTIKFMRWIDENEIDVFFESADGTISKLNPETQIKAEKVIISFPEKGRILEISAGQPCDVIWSDVLPFVGGHTLLLKQGYAKSFNLKIADVNISKLYKKGALTLRMNQNNGTSSIESGAMPLFYVDAFENNSSQSDEGFEKKSSWKFSEMNNDDGSDLIRLSGKIETDWNETICAKAKGVNYSYSTTKAANSGLFVRFPYWLIGCPIEVTCPDGKKIEAIDDIPLRIGIDMEWGEFPAGTVFTIWVTDSEKILVKLQSHVSIRSYRKRMLSYKDAFDSSSDDDFYKNIKNNGSSHAFPPGGWILTKNASTKEIGFDVSYSQSYRPLPVSEDISPTNVDEIILAKFDNGIEIKSPWWKIVHDKNSGGSISQIIFPNASGTNILSAPEKIYAVSHNIEFNNLNNSNTMLFIDDKTLIIKGNLVSSKGLECGISYTSHYEYHEGYIKRKTILYSEKPVRLDKIGILRFDFTSLLDECGYKPIVAAFRKAVFPGPSVVGSHNFGYGFLSVFKSGGEGVDFIPGSISTQWTKQLTSDKTSKLWGISGNGSGGPSIIIEPYSNSNKTIQFCGSACFDYYIGLPKLGRTIPRKYFPARFAEWYFPQKNWINEKIIKTAAEYGANLVTDGNYGVNWVGEEVPQNPSAKEKNELDVLKKRVEKWQENGIKVVPFIGKGLLRSNVAAYKDREVWGQMNKEGKLPDTPWNSLMMCHNAAGYNLYYQKFLEKWKTCLHLDGFYFDFVYPQGPCFNFCHYDCEHSDVDGLMEFMEWVRTNIDLVYGHTGYFPTIMCENLVDLTWVGEEINYWYSTEGRIPGIDQMRQYFCHIDNTQKALDPLIVSRWKLLPFEPLNAYLRYTGSDANEFTCRMALCGLFSEAHIQAGCPLKRSEIFDRLSPWFDMFKIFKGVDFTKFKFKDWRNQNFVLTGNPAVKAAIYWNDCEAYIVLGNPESMEQESYNFKLNTSMLGWLQTQHNCSIKVLPDSLASIMPVSGLQSGGISGILNAYEYRVYKVEVEK